MIKVTYRQRTMLDRYRCVDGIHTVTAQSKWKPAGTGLWYLKVNRFNVVTVADEDIIKVEEV